MAEPRWLSLEHYALAALVGGSISAGMGPNGFGEQSFKRLTAAFPRSGPPMHAFHNGAVGGIMSTYMTACLKWHVPTDIDLVVVRTRPFASML